MDTQLLENAKALLATRRAVAVLAVEFTSTIRGRGFRSEDYKLLDRELSRFESAHADGRACIVSIDARRRFAVARNDGGPAFAFEQHLLTDPLFCDVLARVVRGAVNIASDNSRIGSASISLLTRDSVREVWRSALPLEPGDLPALTLDVPIVRRAAPERRRSLDFLPPPPPSPSRDDLLLLFGNSGRSSRHQFELTKSPRAQYLSFPIEYKIAKKRKPAPPEPETPELVSVFYATDRQPTGDTRPSHFYGYEPAKNLHLGVVTVSMPPKRPIGKVVTPSIWKLQFRPNPMKHMILKSVTKLTKDDYYGRMNATISGFDGKRAFVFVHGYNVTFEDAALRTAQIHQDLNFQGAPIFYSWPSMGTTDGYTYDEAKVGATHLALDAFLREVVKRTGAEEIHVIAHSMGNRAVTAALDRIFVASGAALPFSQLVFAAPDLDADDFEKIAAQIHGAGKRLTLYGSSQDKAILASKKFHRAPRAGDGGPNLVVTADVDSIDASDLDTDFLSHSYIANHSVLLTDLRSLMTADEPPAKRQYIKKRKGGGWRFQPQS